MSLSVIACGEGSHRSPTAPALPTPVPAPAPAPAQEPGPQGVQSWQLDWWLTAVTGDEECVVREWRGSTAFEGETRQPLTIEFSGESVRFLYLPDNTSYTGTRSGFEFEAVAAGWGDVHVCGDGTTHPFQVEILMTGRFSTDWRSLEAVEEWRYRFEGGGSVDLRYEWAAILFP